MPTGILDRHGCGKGADRAAPGVKRDMPKTLISGIFFLLLLLIGVGFAALNATEVQLDYFFGQASLNLPWVVLAAIGVGFLLGLLVSAIAVFRARAEARKVRKERRLMEAELKNLRSLPLRNS